MDVGEEGDEELYDNDNDDIYDDDTDPSPPSPPTLLETSGAFDTCRTIRDLIQRYEDPQFDEKMDLYNSGVEFGVVQRLNIRGYRGEVEFERYRQRYLERSAHANWLRFLANGLKGRDAWWHQ